MGRSLLFFFFLTLCADLYAAEDFDRIAPKAVPTPTAPAPATPPTPLQAMPGENTTVLIPKLKALVFLARPDQVGKGEVKAKGIQLGASVPDPDAFKTLVKPYLGKPLLRGDLNTLVKEIVLYYRAHDRPIVDVIVPEQDVTTGVLQLVLLEGKIGTVTVTGNRWFSSEELKDQADFHSGESLRSSDVQAKLDWLNSNPFHSTDLIYQPGEQLGETNLVLQTQDRFPVRFYTGYEDSGNAQTGFDRYETGFNWGDGFGLGQQINYQYQMSGDDSSLQAHSGSWAIPLPWHHTLTFFGSDVTTRGTIPPVSGLSGTSYQASMRYAIPLENISFAPCSVPFTYTHSVSAGFDYKYNHDSLEFGITPEESSTTEVYQFVWDYTGKLSDPWGITSLDAQFYYSPGSFGGYNNNADFAASHADATSNYVYSTLYLSRLNKLPWDWSLLLKGTIQVSDANLTPSEQLGFGGYDSVRGYDEREVNTDEGYIFTTELHTPPISLTHIADPKLDSKYIDQLQFLTFWDYGAGHNHTLLAGEAEETPLSSVGVGMRYNLGTYVSVRFDYGWQLLATGFDTDHGSRGDVGVTVSY